MSFPMNNEEKEFLDTDAHSLRQIEGVENDKDVLIEDFKTIHVNNTHKTTLLFSNKYLEGVSSIMCLRNHSVFVKEELYANNIEITPDNMIIKMLNDDICGLDRLIPENEPTLKECQELVTLNYFKLTNLVYSFTNQKLSNPNIEAMVLSCSFKVNNIKNYLTGINLFISDIYNSKIPMVTLLENLKHKEYIQNELKEYVLKFTKDACTSLVMIQNYLWHLSEMHFTDYLNVISYLKCILIQWKKSLLCYKEKFTQSVFLETYLIVVKKDPLNTKVKRLVKKYLNETEISSASNRNPGIWIHNYVDVDEIFSSIYCDWYSLKKIIIQGSLDLKYFNDVNLDKRKVVRLKQMDTLLLELQNMELRTRRLDDKVAAISITEYRDLVQRLIESAKFSFQNLKRNLECSLSASQKKYERLKDFCKKLVLKSLVSKSDLFKIDGVFNSSIFQKPFLIHHFKEEFKRLPTFVSEVSDDLYELDSYICYLDYEDDVKEMKEIYYNAKIFLSKLQQLKSSDVTDTLYQLKSFHDNLQKDTSEIESEIVDFFGNSVLSGADMTVSHMEIEKIRKSQLVQLETKYNDNIRFLQKICHRYHIPIVQNSIKDLEERIKINIDHLRSITDVLINSLCEYKEVCDIYLYNIDRTNNVPSVEISNVAHKLVHIHRNIVAFTKFYRVQESMNYIAVGVLNPRIYFRRRTIHWLLRELSYIMAADILHNEEFPNDEYENNISFEIFFQDFTELCKECCNYFKESLRSSIQGLKFIFLGNYQLNIYKRNIKLAAHLLICLQLINTHVLTDSFLFMIDDINRKNDRKNYFECIIEQLRISYDTAANTYHSKCRQWKIPHLIYSTYESYYGVSMYSTTVIDKAGRFLHENKATGSFSTLYPRYSDLEKNFKGGCSRRSKQPYVKMHYFKKALSLNHTTVEDMRSVVYDFRNDLISPYQGYTFLRRLMSRTMIYQSVNILYPAQISQFILQHFLNINNKTETAVINWRDLVIFVLLHSKGSHREDHIISILDIINPQKFSRYAFKDFWRVIKQIYRCLQYYASEPWYNYIIRDKFIHKNFCGNELKSTNYAGGRRSLHTWIKMYNHIIQPFQLSEYYTIFENVDYWFQCHGCKNTITRMLYKCMDCSEVYFCENCFEIPADIKSHRAHHSIKFITERWYEGCLWRVFTCGMKSVTSRSKMGNENNNYLTTEISSESAEQAINKYKALLGQLFKYKSSRRKIKDSQYESGCFLPKATEGEDVTEVRHRILRFTILLLKKYLHAKEAKFEPVR